MAEKCFGIIQEFKKNDLLNFLKKNGYSEYEEILISEQVIDGEKFLGLNELQITKWKLSPGLRKKFWSFLTEIKQNPQKFVRQADTQDKDLNVNGKKNCPRMNNFKERLALVIRPKSSDGKPVKNYSAVSPLPKEVKALIPINKTEKSETQNNDTRYVILNKHNIEQKKNYDEPPPATKIVTNFAAALIRRCSNSPMSKRAQLALPRASTDKQGYICRPEEVAAKSTVRDTIKSNNAEEVEYAIVNEINKIVDSMNTTSGEQENAEIQSMDDSDDGTILKIMSHFRKINDLDLSSDQNRMKPKESSLERQNLLKDNKLPSLKHWAYNPHDQASKLKHHIIRNISLRGEALRKPYSPEMLPTIEKISKSENDLVSKNNGETYGNDHRQKSNYYCVIKDLKRGIKLPKPPTKFPSNPIISLSNMDHEDPEHSHSSIPGDLDDETFCRNTDRKGVKELLSDLDDGAFLFRPSKSSYLTLSLKYNEAYVSLNIEKTKNNHIRLEPEGDRIPVEFPTLTAFVSHYTNHSLTFEHEGEVVTTHLKTFLPPDRF